MSSQGLNSLATIIKRLEAATSRLEDIAASQTSTHPGRPSADLPAGAGPSAAAAPPAPPPPPEVVPEVVAAYDTRIINGKLAEFLSATEQLNHPPLLEQAKYVGELFKYCRTIILCATASRKPNNQEFATLLKPMVTDFEKISQLQERNRSSRDWSFHFQALSEGASCMQWLQWPNAPAPFIAEQKNATEFYSNRVIKEHKDKDPKHVTWARSYTSLIDELAKYVSEFHKPGLTWNPQGGKVDEFKAPSKSASAPAGGPPPPPPPPAAPAPPPPPPASGSGGGGGAAAVFAELNKGADITKGLRKVDASEMTHKNPSLRGNAPVPATSPSGVKSPPKPKKPVALQAKKPSKLELQGTKWIVEYQENEKSLILENVEKHHVVNIYGCKNSVIHVKGKVNAVTMANCQKTAVLVESVISSVSITNSGSFQLQIVGSAPTIQVDTSDSGQIYLSKECLNTEILTAKSSALNVSIPEGNEDGVFVERPIPEMLRTVVQGDKLVTTIVEHSG